MKPVPGDLRAGFQRALDSAAVAPQARAQLLKWLRYYLDFCAKYACSPDADSTVAAFMAKLASKAQDEARRPQAARAVEVYQGMSLGPRQPSRSRPVGRPADQGRDTMANPEEVANAGLRAPAENPGRGSAAAAGPESAAAPQPAPASRPDQPQTEAAAARETALFPAEAGSGRSASWEAEYAGLEGAIRRRNYSPKTLEACRFWLHSFQASVRSKPSGKLGDEDVKAFLTDLAVRQGVTASTQNHAFNALLFFYRHVLGRDFGRLSGVVRAKRRPYVPVVLSRVEVEAVLTFLDAPYRLVATLLYGCGPRQSECLELQVHCLNLEARLLTVHDGKGQKDRSVPLPERALPAIREQMEEVRRLHQQDIEDGYSGTFLPKQLAKKYRNAAPEFIWQWFFSAPTLTRVAGSGTRRRYHVHASHVQHAIKQAAASAGITKPVSPTPCATPSRVTCCWPATICPRSRRCSVTVISRRP